MILLITLCARGGSKGIPGKNIKKLNGLPLIEYSLRLAKRIADYFPGSVVELSTDDLEIADVAANLGLETDYLRPAHLGIDTAGKVDVIRDLFTYSEATHGKSFDYILDLDISSPLRSFADIQNALGIMVADQAALTLFSVSKAHKNPYFNMVEINAQGYYELSKQRPDITLSRQLAPLVYELNASFYIYRPEFFKSGLKGVITDRSLIYEMSEICFDLDTPMDFEYMEYLLVNGKVTIELV